MSWNISLKQGGELFNGRPLSPNVCWNLIAKTFDAVHSYPSNDCSTFCGNDCNIYFQINFWTLYSWKIEFLTFVGKISRHICHQNGDEFQYHQDLRIDSIPLKDYLHCESLRITTQCYEYHELRYSYGWSVSGPPWKIGMQPSR